MLHERFEITISPPTEDGYSIRGESTLFGRTDWQLVRPDFEQLNRHVRDIASRNADEQHLISYGEVLFDIVVPMGSIRDLFHRSLGKAEGKGFGLHICLPLDPPELAALPWEYLHHRDLGWLAASIKTPVVRSPAITVEIQEFHVNPPLRLLFLAPESAQLDAAGEAGLLEEALRGVKPPVELEILRERVTVDRIAERLNRNAFHVVHFMGHAVFANDESYIHLDDDSGSQKQVRGSDFANLFTNHRSLKLVVLNACEGAQVSGTRPLVGLVPELMRRGVPGVVGMQFRIYDKVALTFTESFYQTLFQGSSRGRVDLAITEARNHLATKYVSHPKASRALGAPVLFVSVPTGQIYTTQAASPWSLFTPAEAQLDSVTQETIEGKQGGHVDEQSRLEIKSRLRRRRGARLCAAVLVFVTTVLMLKLAWQGVLEKVRGDSFVRTLIVKTGDHWLSERVHPDLVLITAQQSKVKKIVKNEEGRDVEVEDWVAWRKWYAELIRKLADADASVVASNIVFFDDEQAEELGQAMTQAAEMGTETIAAYDCVSNGEPKIAQPVRIAAGMLASSILTEGGEYAYGFCTRAPLAIFVASAEKRPPAPTVGLAAYCLHRGLKSADIPGAIEVDRVARKLRVDLPNGVEFFNLFDIPISDPTEDDGAEDARPDDDDDCTPIEQVVESQANIVMNFPDRLAGRTTAYALGDVLNMGAADLRQAFENRIVLIGQELENVRFAVRTSSGGTSVFGVRITASIINALLIHGEIGRVSSVTEQFLVMMLGVLGGIMGWFFGSHHAWKRMVYGTSIVFAYVVLTILFYVTQRLLFDAIYPLLAYLLAYWSSGLTRRKWYTYS